MYLHAIRTYLQGTETHLQVLATLMAIAKTFLLAHQHTLPVNELLLFIQPNKLPTKEQHPPITLMRIRSNRHSLLIKSRLYEKTRSYILQLILLTRFNAIFKRIIYSPVNNLQGIAICTKINAVPFKPNKIF